MNESDALTNLPKLQIKPFDGMPITAETWAQAHEEHRIKQQVHDVVFHGAGVVTGLEVVANDPPDQYVFISPGMAVDSAGNMIVLTETVAYDFGNTMEGELYLLLGHGEREIADSKKDLRFIQSEFVIAARPSIPKRPAVELARVFLTKRGNAIKNPADQAHPAADEIDTRFRVSVGIDRRETIKVGLCSLSKKAPADVLKGWDALSREYVRSTKWNLAIDNTVAVSSDILNYSILYLIGKGSFTLTAAETKELAAYIDQGKGLIAEALDGPADESFKVVFEGLKVSLKQVSDRDPILEVPYLFNSPPEGNHGSDVWLGKKVIYTTANYSLAWGGKVSDGTGSREKIRSAHEWGINMIEACL